MKTQDVCSRIENRFIHNQYPFFFNKVNDKVFITSIDTEIVISKEYIKVLIECERVLSMKTTHSLYKYAVVIYYLYIIFPYRFIFTKLINEILKIFDREQNQVE
ncbi:MAG: hypothetical protein QXF12_02515 [Candidatus Aenigmatarchaeota archaeon]